MTFILVTAKQLMSSSLGIDFLLQQRNWSGQERTWNFHSLTPNGGKWLHRTLSRLHHRIHGLVVPQLHDLLSVFGRIRRLAGDSWFARFLSTCFEFSLAGSRPSHTWQSSITLEGRFWTWSLQAARGQWDPIIDQQDLFVCLIGMPSFDLEVTFLEDSVNVVGNLFCFRCSFSGPTNIIHRTHGLERPLRLRGTQLVITLLEYW